MKISEKKKQ